MMVRVVILLCVLLPSAAHAAEYYISTSGNDTTGTGAIDNPWRTLTSSAAKVACGDTLYIRGGTYTTEGRPTFTQDCAESSRLVVRNYPGELPILQWSNRQNTSTGIQFTSAERITLQGIELYSGYNIKIDVGTRLIFRFLRIHHMGSDGIQRGTVGGCYQCTVEYSELYDNGDYTLCSGAQAGPLCNQIHGMYLSGQEWTIVHNLIYDNLAYGIQTNGMSAAKCTFAGDNPNYCAFSGTIANNTFAYQRNRAGIVLWNESTTPEAVTIKNNIFYENSQQVSTEAQGIKVTDDAGVHTGTVIQFNIAYATVSGNTAFMGGGTCSGCTISDNCPATQTGNCGTAPTFTNAPSTVPASPDFTLTASSSAIDAGTSVTGILCNGTCDVGAFESLGGFSSATLDSTLLDVTLLMNLNTPVLPSSAITGFTVSCTGSDCGTPVVASASRHPTSDGVIRLTISGIGGSGVCAVGQTWTVSYSGGNVTDSALIGNTLNQSMFAFSNQGVTEVCTGSGTTPPSGGLDQYLKFDEGTGTNVADEAGGDNPGTLTGGPGWATGKTGSAVSFTDASNQYVATGLGSGANPSTQSLSFCVGVLPDTGSLGANKGILGAPLGTNQRFYLSWDVGAGGPTWGIGVQSSPSSSVNQSEFVVTAAWTRICVVFNSGTDVATLYVNGTKGATSAAVKSYTSFTLSGNIQLGRIGDVSGGTFGGAIDDWKYYTAALTDQEVADDYANWNEASPEPTGTFEQKTHKWQRLRKKVDGSAEDFTISGSTNGITMSVMVGGAIALVTQIDCTVADCVPTGARLYYSKNGGSWLQVPDLCATDGVCFYGASGDSDVVSGTVECCLTGALTENDGPTNFTASAVPVFDLAQDGSFVLRSILKFGSGLTGGTDSFCFKEYHQTNLELNGGYTPSGGACVTIVPISMGVGF